MRALHLITGVIAMAAAAHAQDVERDAVRFLPLEEAMEASAAEEKVLAVYFTAEWCGWCRKMEGSTLGDAEVAAAARAMAWTKVDIDERPDIAAAFGVRGVPATVLLNARGELLGRRDGYLPKAEMLALLAEFRGQALEPGEARANVLATRKAAAAIGEAATDEEVVAAVDEALALLADAAMRDRREPLWQSLAAGGQRVLSPLASRLADERLATRAAASEALRRVAPDAPAFDAFAEPGERGAQLAAVREWIASRSAGEPAPR